jgi:hypothetical protein
MFEKSKINFQVKIDSDNYQISYENGDEYIGGINNERKSHRMMCRFGDGYPNCDLFYYTHIANIM